MLNSFGSSRLPAFTPVLHNLAVIAGDAVAGAAASTVPAMALAWGVLVAGAAAAAAAVAGAGPARACGRGCGWTSRHEGVRRVFELMLPTLFSSSVAQLNLLVGTMFASLLVDRQRRPGCTTPTA